MDKNHYEFPDDQVPTSARAETPFTFPDTTAVSDATLEQLIKKAESISNAQNTDSIQARPDQYTDSEASIRDRVRRISQTALNATSVDSAAGVVSFEDSRDYRPLTEIIIGGRREWVDTAVARKALELASTVPDGSPEHVYVLDENNVFVLNHPVDTKESQRLIANIKAVAEQKRRSDANPQ